MSFWKYVISSLLVLFIISIFGAMMETSPSGTAIEAAPERSRLVSMNGQTVIVWKNKTALRESITLINAGVSTSEKPELFLPLMACVVGSGTKAVETDGDSSTATILVVEGDQSGCRGIVPIEYFPRLRQAH